MITQWLPSSVLANLHGNYVNRLCTTKTVNKGKLATSAMELAKVKVASCLLSLHFMDSTILATSISTDQKGKEPKSVIKGLPEQFGTTR